MKRFGKKWFFITPDYAYGHTLQDAFIKNLKKAGGEFEGDMLPINTTEFSATLIKAKAYKPNVLLNNMGGLAQIDCMKQFVQFGMAKDMALGGALFEMESIKSVPKDAQTGWWDMEWWWDQPNVPEVPKFVAAFRKAMNKTPTARHWFGYVAVNSVRLAAEKGKSLEGPKMAVALEDLELPPDVALQPGSIRYRAGDHELMANIFVGQAHPPEGNPDNVFKVEALVPGEQAAGPVADTGCKMTPSQPDHARYTSEAVALERASGEEDAGEPANASTHPVQCHQRIDHRHLLRADGAWPLADPQSQQCHQLRPRQLPRPGRLYRLCADPFIGFWGALIVSPILTAVLGFIIERLMIRRVYSRDPVYSLLLTFGLAFILQDVCRYIWGPNGLPLGVPDACRSRSAPICSSSPGTASSCDGRGHRRSRGAVRVPALSRVGVRIRAGTLDLETVAALGVNVRLLRSFNFALGSLLAGLGGVLAAARSASIPTWAMIC